MSGSNPERPCDTAKCLILTRKYRDLPAGWPDGRLDPARGPESITSEPFRAETLGLSAHGGRSSQFSHPPALYIKATHPFKNSWQSGMHLTQQARKPAASLQRLPSKK